MIDLLDELRDANPIDPDRVEVAPYSSSRSPRPRPRRAWRLVVVAAPIAVALVAALALIPGRATKPGGPTLAARAYAAVTKPGVVHWRTALRTHVNGQGHTQTITEGWSHNGVTHILMWELHNHKPRLVMDTRSAGGRTATWTANSDTILRGKAVPTGSDPNTLGDPMAIFRRAYRAGKLAPLAPNRLKVDLPGRSDNEGDFTAYYDMDPKTALPLRYVLAGRDGDTTTVQIRVYETLPFTDATRAKLRMLDHPAPASATTSAEEHFAVLRHGPRPTGDLAAAVEQLAERQRFDASAARQVAPGYALVPSKDGVCLVSVNAGGAGAGCVGLTYALRRGIGAGVPNPRPVPTRKGQPRMEAGIRLVVPDGVVAVKTRFHGKWTRRPVRDNYLRIPRFSGQYVFVRG
ncbi:hypothetical protein [Solirubrobacter soli]|uniref:hypothetical protein n=1 Tax=Solirubrobacter soli TaxID=363832 RepID=UPI00040A1F11|nr:hypothetical protein [Solirubrobacter soli]